MGATLRLPKVKAIRISQGNHYHHQAVMMLLTKRMRRKRKKSSTIKHLGSQAAHNAVRNKQRQKKNSLPTGGT
jgi:hypothetical protein